VLAKLRVREQAMCSFCVYCNMYMTIEVTAENMSKLYVHPVTGNVGIGTDKPEGILDIKSVITNAAFPPPGMSNVVAVPDYTDMVDSIDVGNMPTLVEYPPPLHLSATAQAVVNATVNSVTQSTITVAGSTYGNGVYVAFASSFTSGGEYIPYKAFNKSSDNTANRWLSIVTTGVYGGVNYVYAGAITTTASSQTLSGEWLQLRTPSPGIAVKSYTISANGDTTNENLLNGMPVKWWVAGSTNGTTWTLLDTQSNITWSTIFQSRTFTINNDVIYEYYRLIINQTRSSSSFTTIGEWALSADTPYATIREFPPGPMLDDQVDILAMYGSGRYVASASSQLDLVNYVPFKAFNKALGGTEVNTWICATNTYDTTGYLGSVKTTSISNVVYAGEWLQIQLPHPITLQSYDIGIVQFAQYGPKVFYILGSIDGINWVLLNSQTAQTGWTINAYRSFTVGSTTAYTYFRLVTQSNNVPSSVYASIGEWKLFGSLHQKYPKLTLPLLGSQSTYGTGAYKAYANTLYNPGTPIAGNPTNAIDANAATFWRSGSNIYTSAVDASPVPTVYFEFPDGLKATSYALTARQNAVTAFDEAPSKWNLYGSNVAVPGSWALLDARANISTWAAENPKSFALTGNTTFYKAYKLEVLRNNSASGNFITIRDLQWIGDKQTPDTKLMITSGGRIGMNALASSEYMLNVDGNIRATGDLMANGYVMGLPKMAIIQDRKPYNVNAGQTANAGINTRQLNTIVFDTIGITLINNRFTVPSGSYHIFASGVFMGPDRHQMRLRNITYNTTTCLGTSEQSVANIYVSSRSFIDDVFTISSSSTFELQHFAYNAQSAASTFGIETITSYFDNVYTAVRLVKYI